MENINVVVLSGRLTKDAELTHISTGTAIARLSLAVNKSVKEGDRWTDKAMFFDCKLWGKRAEALTQYLVRGRKVTVHGSLDWSQWEKDGAKRTKVEVNISHVELWEKPKDNQEQLVKKVFEDDIPF